MEAAPLGEIKERIPLIGGQLRGSTYLVGDSSKP